MMLEVNKEVQTAGRNVQDADRRDARNADRRGAAEELQTAGRSVQDVDRRDARHIDG